MTEASAWFLLISPQKIADFSMRVQLSVGLLPGSCGTPDRILSCVPSNGIEIGETPMAKKRKKRWQKSGKSTI